MADLRESLNTLVDHPPVAPVGVEVVAARAARFVRRRRVLGSAVGLAVIAVVSATSLLATRQDAEPAVFLATHGATSAGYVAEQPGGYVASGAWHLTITRGEQIIELSSTSSHHCGWIGVIQPGDAVRGSISGPDSTLRVGEHAACPS